MQEWASDLQPYLAETFGRMFQLRLLKPDYAEKIMCVIFKVIDNGSEDVSRAK